MPSFPVATAMISSVVSLIIRKMTVIVVLIAAIFLVSCIALMVS